MNLAWRDFSCQSLACSYHDLGRYARRQRKDILLECNPGGPGQRIQPPVDHGRILTGGEAFWDEDVTLGYHDGLLRTRIRTYKLGRTLNNLTFAYTTTPLEAAEAMAFNLDCLGCVCWFEYGKLVARPGSDRPVSTNLRDYVRSGGRLCIIGPVATHDEWLRPRSKPVLQDLPPARVVRLPESDDCLAAVQRACGGRPSLSIDAPAGLCAELTEQVGRRLVHLVNYRANAPLTNATITVRLPPGTTGQAVRLMSPEHAESTDLVSEQRSDCISFRVPRVNVYEIAVVEFSKRR